jgi:hypothetical protein
VAYMQCKHGDQKQNKTDTNRTSKRKCKCEECFIRFIRFAYFPVGLGLVALLQYYAYRFDDTYKSHGWSTGWVVAAGILAALAGVLAVFDKLNLSLRLRIVLIVLLGAGASFALLYDKAPPIYLVAAIGVAVLASAIAFIRIYSPLTAVNQTSDPETKAKLEQYEARKDKEKRVFQLVQLIVIGVGAILIAFIANALSVQVMYGNETAGLSVRLVAHESVVAIAGIAAYYFAGAGLMFLDTLLSNS